MLAVWSDGNGSFTMFKALWFGAFQKKHRCFVGCFTIAQYIIQTDLSEKVERFTKMSSLNLSGFTLNMAKVQNMMSVHCIQNRGHTGLEHI